MPAMMTQRQSKNPIFVGGGDEQMFGANQQVSPRARMLPKRRRQRGVQFLRHRPSWQAPVAGSRCRSYRPLAARVALNLSMNRHHPELYFFLCLLTGLAAILAILLEIQRLEQRSRTRLLAAGGVV